MALLGPSGCGKSTILNMVAGLLPRSGGRILIDEDVVEPGKVNRKVGYVFQRDTVFPWRTVEAEYRLWPGDRGPARKPSARRASPRPSRPPASPASQSFPRTLSGGMRQRVALMRTLIMEPEILLMDEPFGALDTHTKLEMHGRLLEIWERERQTVLFVTHDLGEALDAREPHHPALGAARAPQGRFRRLLPAAARPRGLARDSRIRPALFSHLAFPRRRISPHEGR